MDKKTLDFHLCDHCNLNCYYCDHVSPWCKERTHTLKEFENNLILAKKLENIFSVIHLTGGEPLLVKHIWIYLIKVREIYPDKQIVLYTNGILLPKMTDEFWFTLKHYNIRLHISIYPVLDKKSTMELITEKGVFAYAKEIKKMLDIEWDFTAKNGHEAYSKCFRCPFVYDGKLYPCPRLCLAINKDKNFPDIENSYLDLKDINLSEERILNFLENPTVACDYCVTHKEKNWRITNENDFMENN